MARLTKDKLLGCKDNLLSILSLYGDYDKALGLKRRILLVEGPTDQSFIGRIKEPEARCLSVSDFMRNRAVFSTTQASQDYNSKDVIIELLKHLQCIPEYLQFPRGANEWPVFGLVDNDFETDHIYSLYKRLFFTGAHDIETFMLSTDESLLTRLEDCVITPDDAKKAFFIAYQMAFYRQAIRTSGFFAAPKYEKEDGTMDYQLFTDGILVEPRRLLDYVNDTSKEGMSAARLKKCEAKVKQILKKKLNTDGTWKQTLDDFGITEDDEFWHEVNGHDICSALKYISVSANTAFASTQGFRKNRSFELALSKAYDYSKGKDTALFKNLSSAQLVIVI